MIQQSLQMASLREGNCSFHSASSPLLHRILMHEDLNTSSNTHGKSLVEKQISWSHWPVLQGLQGIPVLEEMRLQWKWVQRKQKGCKVQDFALYNELTLVDINMPLPHCFLCDNIILLSWRFGGFGVLRLFCFALFFLLLDNCVNIRRE